MNKNKTAKRESIFQKRFRELFGDDITKVYIADKLNTSRQNVGNWISGETIPNINTLACIAKVGNVSADYLIGLTDVKSMDLKIQEISKLTGLSEASIVKLSLLKKSAQEDNNDQLFLDIINRFIENI